MKTIIVIDENRDVFTFADIQEAAEYIAKELRGYDVFNSEYISYNISGDTPVTMTHSVNGMAKDFWTEDNAEASDYKWQTLNNVRD